MRPCRKLGRSVHTLGKTFPDWTALNGPLSNLLAVLRMNLFTQRDLWAGLDQQDPAPQPIEALQQQLLALG